MKAWLMGGLIGAVSANLIVILLFALFKISVENSFLLLIFLIITLPSVVVVVSVDALFLGGDMWGVSGNMSSLVFFLLTFFSLSVFYFVIGAIAGRIIVKIRSKK